MKHDNTVPTAEEMAAWRKRWICEHPDDMLIVLLGKGLSNSGKDYVVCSCCEAAFWK